MQLSGTNFPLHNKRLQPGRLTLLIILLLATLLLAACDTGSQTPAATQAPTAETPAETEPTAPPTAAEPSTAPTEPAAMTGEGVLRVAMQPIVQVDPAFISSDSEVLVANHVYDYLVDIDPQSNPVGRLAASWSTSDDGLTWTFELVDGVTWHDGGPFTAADVVWTFDRLRDPAAELPTSDLYQNVDTVTATGDLQVTFTLKEPNPFFLYDLSDNHALIVKNGTEDASDFNGTGPFIVTNYSAEDRIEMRANENYFVDGLPKLAGLQIIFFNDETAAIDALRGGQVDLSMRMSTSLFESLQADPNINTFAIPTNGFDLVRLRADRPPGNDPRAIQALKLATDREVILQLVQQGYGAVGNDSPIGPLYEAYHAEDITPPARDVDAARDLWAAARAEAADPAAFDLVLHTPDTGGRPDLATVLQAQWAEAGIDIEISVEPESVYYGDDGWLEVNLGITGWGSRPYPQFYLDVMLVCNAQWNESHFCDEQFDQLARRAGTTLDEATRIDAYRQIQALLAERGPVIIPYYFAQFGALSNRFEGFELKAFAGRTDLRGVSPAP